MTTLATDRLILRLWRDEDREPFAALNADPEVMRYFPHTLTRSDSDALFERFVREWGEGGSFHAVEERASGRFIGFVGVGPLPATLPIAPAMQVGWRLGRHAWGNGYATEAARVTIDHAFADASLAEIVSYTVAANTASRRVMAKLGLERAAARDFAHPALPEGHPLRPHILYRIRRSDWPGARSA